MIDLILDGIGSILNNKLVYYFYVTWVRHFDGSDIDLAFYYFIHICVVSCDVTQRISKCL